MPKVDNTAATRVKQDVKATIVTPEPNTKPQLDPISSLGILFE